MYDVIPLEALRIIRPAQVEQILAERRARGQLADPDKLLWGYEYTWQVTDGHGKRVGERLFAVDATRGRRDIQPCYRRDATLIPL